MPERYLLVGDDDDNYDPDTGVTSDDTDYGGLVDGEGLWIDTTGDGDIVPGTTTPHSGYSFTRTVPDGVETHLSGSTLGSRGATETSVDSVLVPTTTSPSTTSESSLTSTEAVRELVDGDVKLDSSHSSSESSGEIPLSNFFTEHSSELALSISNSETILSDVSTFGATGLLTGTMYADRTSVSGTALISAENTKTSVTASAPLALSDSLGSSLTTAVGVGAKRGRTAFHSLGSSGLTEVGVGGIITSSLTNPRKSAANTITRAESLATISKGVPLNSSEKADTLVSALTESGYMAPTVSVGESVVTSIGQIEVGGVTAVGSTLSTRVYAQIGPQNAHSDAEIGSTFTTTDVSGEVVGASYTPISPSMSIVTNVGRTDSGVGTLTSDSLASAFGETSATVTLAKTVAESSTLMALLDTSSETEGAVATTLADSLTSNGNAEVTLDALRTLISSEAEGESSTASQTLAALTGVQSDTEQTTEHAFTHSEAQIPTAVYEALESEGQTSSTADLVATAVEAVQDTGHVYSSTDVAAMSSLAVSDYLTGKPYTRTDTVGDDTNVEVTEQTGFGYTEVVISAINALTTTTDLESPSFGETDVEAFLSEMELRGFEADGDSLAEVGGIMTLADAATREASEHALTLPTGEVVDSMGQSLVSTLNTEAVSDAALTTLDSLESTGVLDTTVVANAITTFIEAVAIRSHEESITKAASFRTAASGSTLGSDGHAASIALGMIATGAVEPIVGVRLFMFASITGNNSVELLSGNSFTRLLNGESVVEVISNQFGRVLNPYNDLEVTK